MKRWAVPPPTHTNSKGGALYVNFSGLDEFYKEYCVQINKGLPLSIVENRTPVFKMFLEFDLQWAYYAPNMEYCLCLGTKIVKVVQTVADDFWELPLLPELVLLTTEPTEPSPDRSKCGLRLVWSNIFVTRDTALKFRKLAIQALVDKLPLMQPWEMIVDESVFSKKGLSMPWSFKAHFESGCALCSSCDAAMEIVTYKPRKLFAGTNSIDMATTPSVEILRLTSVCTYNHVSKIKVSIAA